MFWKDTSKSGSRLFFSANNPSSACPHKRRQRVGKKGKHGNNQEEFGKTITFLALKAIELKFHSCFKTNLICTHLSPQSVELLSALNIEELRCSVILHRSRKTYRASCTDPEWSVPLQSFPSCDPVHHWWPSE